jgi:hypothetical protein
VWVVMIEIAFEGGVLDSVWSTEEGADARADKLNAGGSMAQAVVYDKLVDDPGNENT